MAANYDPQLLQNITWDSLNTLDLSEDAITFARGALERVTEIVQERDAALAKINNDPNLSEVGKQARIAVANDAAQRNLAQHSSGVLAKTSAMIGDLQRLMQPTPLPKDSASTTLLLIERRAILREMDVLQVGVCYLDAAKIRDDITLTAIDTAPPYDTVFQIAADVKQQGKFIRGQMESPDAAAQLKTISQLDAQLRSVIGAAEQALGVPDALTTQAGIRVPRGNAAVKAAA